MGGALPEAWEPGEEVVTQLDGETIRFSGITFREYQNALDEAVRTGRSDPRSFCELLREEYGADAAVAGGRTP